VVRVLPGDDSSSTIMMQAGVSRQLGGFRLSDLPSTRGTYASVTLADGDDDDHIDDRGESNCTVVAINMREALEYRYSVRPVDAHAQSSALSPAATVVLTPRASFDMWSRYRYVSSPLSEVRYGIRFCEY